MSTRRVAHASPEELAQAMEIVGRAFAEDPLLHRLFPGLPNNVQTYRYKEMEHANVGALFQGAGFAHVGRDDSGRIVTLAVWGSPLAPRGISRFSWAHLWRAIRSISNRAPNIYETWRTYDKHRPKEPHWYLHLLATEESARGTGITSQVIKAGLTAVDSTHAPAYLEASGEHLVPLYEHFGFRRCGTLPPRNGSHPVPMYRPAVCKRKACDVPPAHFRTAPLSGSRADGNRQQDSDHKQKDPRSVESRV